MNIVYLDDAVIVVNKPAGLPVLPDGWGSEGPYLVKLLQDEHGGPPSAGSGIWTVHRLDKTTSGVMIFARTEDAHRSLNRQFELHQTDKLYHAIAVGVPPWDEKTARHPLRANVGHKHRTAVDPRRGKSAETQFKVLRRFGAHTLLEARPATGRTHQVRVHAYALGYPLLGDTLYGGAPSELISRPALHAYSLGITHPVTGQHETYSAPYPEDFARVLEQLSI